MLGIFCKDIKVNSNNDDIKKCFVKFVKDCNWFKKYIDVLIICGKKNCIFPSIMKFKLTENEDLDELLESIKINNYVNFVKKNLKDKEGIEKIDFNSVINREVEYTMYPSSNSLIISFY